MNTTAIILNWNTLHITKDSYRRLAKEVPVIILENGSDDGSLEYFKSLKDNPKIIHYYYNAGNCIPRNNGIDLVQTDYFFLLDGDILYVPKSIKILEEILNTYKQCGCVGVHNMQNVAKYGHNGTPNKQKADLRSTKPDAVFSGFPMAWTQYGLFRKTDQRFITKKPFNKPGQGYEDSWYYHEMKSRGLDSWFITKPLYYHQAHSGKRELEKYRLPTFEQDRKKIFENKWGKVDWIDGYKIKQVK